jgi:Niemann-Pick C1 protein
VYFIFFNSCFYNAYFDRVDNIFIIVHAFDKLTTKAYNTDVNPEEAHRDEGSYSDIELRIAHAMGKVGPSIILATIAEVVTFSIGGLVDMPAVSSFSLYASAAVLFDSFFQVCMIFKLAIDLLTLISFSSHALLAFWL